MKFSNINLRVIFLVSVIAISTSCSKEEKSDFTPLYLTDYAEVATFTKEQMFALIAENQMFSPELSILVKYGVKGYRIEYETISPFGEKILASGALLVPDYAYSLPVISFQHSTITDEESAPSNFLSDFNELAAIFASTGYVIVLPDYLGYGASKNIPHPYEHRSSLATTCRDMLRASFEFFKLNKLNQTNDKIFLTGYSEGGFATMATFKLLQENHPNEFNIKGVTVGAGAYNKTEFMKQIVNSTENLPHISNYAWVLDTYNSIYLQLNRSYSDYFNEPWASTIENYGVFATYESNPSLLFKSDFIEGLQNETDTDFLNAIADNDCYSWVPNSPLKLYHGTADVFVPYINSQTTYNTMIGLGATSVELVPITGGDHYSSVAEYAVGTFSFFQSLSLN